MQSFNFIMDIFREQRIESTSLIRRSVWISIPLHQRQSRFTFPTSNKAVLFINLRLSF